MFIFDFSRFPEATALESLSLTPHENIIDMVRKTKDENGNVTGIVTPHECYGNLLKFYKKHLLP